MKATTLLSILPVAVSAATLDPRQFGQANVAGVDKLEPRIRAGAQRTLTKFGPYTLRGSKGGAGAGAGGMGMSMGGMDSTLAGQMMFMSINKGFCNDDGPCTVLGGKVGVMFEDGSKADPSTGVYIHHVLTADTTKRANMFLSACNNPNRQGMSVSSLGVGSGFIGTGEDSGDKPYRYVTADGKSDTGFHVEKGDKFLANVQLVNYNPDAKKVYVTYDLEWVPGKVGQNTRGMLISVTQCGTGIKLSENGPTNSTSGKFTFLEDGNLLTARGHLHDGGVSVDVIINDKLICESKAGYGGVGSTAKINGKDYAAISSMSMCDGPIPVKKGDTLVMNVQYDLVKHPLRQSSEGHAAAGVMGMLSLTFATNPE